MQFAVSPLTNVSGRSPSTGTLGSLQALSGVNQAGASSTVSAGGMAGAQSIHRTPARNPELWLPQTNPEVALNNNHLFNGSLMSQVEMDSGAGRRSMLVPCAPSQGMMAAPAAFMATHLYPPQAGMSMPPPPLHPLSMMGSMNMYQQQQWMMNMVYEQRQQQQMFQTMLAQQQQQQHHTALSPLSAMPGTIPRTPSSSSSSSLNHADVQRLQQQPYTVGLPSAPHNTIQQASQQLLAKHDKVKRENGGFESALPQTKRARPVEYSSSAPSPPLPLSNELRAASSSSNGSIKRGPSSSNKTKNGGGDFEGLGGQDRLQVEFASMGELPETCPIQTFGRQKLPIPDGIAGTHRMYSQAWRFEIRYNPQTTLTSSNPKPVGAAHSMPTIGPCSAVCLMWKVTNMFSGLETTVVESQQQAMIRQESGRTISNLVMQQAMEDRAQELERTIQAERRERHQQHSPEEFAIRETNIQNIVRRLRPKRCGEGLLFFGLRHDEVQHVHFKRFQGLMSSSNQEQRSQAPQTSTTRPVSQEVESGTSPVLIQQTEVS